MGRSRGPGVALAWAQTASMGVPPGPPARVPSCWFACVGCPCEEVPFLEISAGTGDSRWSYGWEWGSKARAKALVACSGPAFIPTCPVLVWLEEEEARALVS